MSELVKIAFEQKVVILPIMELLPTKALPAVVRDTVKYRRIAASVAEVGLIEPLSVARFREQRLTSDSRLDSRLSFGGGVGRADWFEGR